MTILTRLRKHKMLPTALVIAVLIAAPTAANVYAQSAEDTETDNATAKETAKKETNEVTNQQQVITEETPEVTPEPSVEPEVTPDPALTAVTLAQAQVIAETEHPSSVVLSSATKTVNNEVVYKFKFADSWKIYVRASDGTVIKVQDASDKDHACQNKHKKSANKERSRERRGEGNARSANWERKDSHMHRDHRSDRH